MPKSHRKDEDESSLKHMKILKGLSMLFHKIQQNRNRENFLKL